MQLQELASLLLLSRIDGDPNTEISGIQTDSRLVQQGDLFICLRGYHVDGHTFAAKAVEQGAVALVVERDVDVDVPKLIVQDCRYAMAVIANHFYEYPSHKLKLIGITGTNGKTTVSYLLEQIFKDQQLQTALMGTIEMKMGGQTYEVKNTTQEALELQRNLRKMVDLGTDVCVMEVSSHALELGRVKGCRFRSAIFTNLTQDHLDFHQTMERYREAKGLLFSRLGNTFSADPASRSFVILNADDPASTYFHRLTTAQVVTYGIDQDADVRAEDIQLSATGTRFKVRSFAGQMDFALQLVGKFSVYNALAAITAALVEGISLEEIQKSLGKVTGVAGRFESVQAGQPFLTIVDYAHTPDSLENVLRTIREMSEGKVYTVFGCGGDRDRSKRPLMGAIAAQYSDYVIITSDNPRSEDPLSIIHDIEQGIIQAGHPSTSYERIVDRKAAIEKAVEMASPKDIILIAGKGHETYQEVNGTRTYFDDRQVAKNAIRSLYID